MADYIALRPAFDRSSALYTYQDAVDVILDMFDSDGSDRSLRNAKRAARESLTEICSHHDWPYYFRLGTLKTVQNQQVGTITYDHTGGAYERLVTLTGATFPVDARYYKIEFGDSVYEIEEYKSSTTVTLRVGSNPGADVSSTTYNLFRANYPVPMGYIRGTSLVDEATVTPLKYVPPREIVNYLAGNYTAQQPYAYSVRESTDYYGHLSFDLIPPPSDEWSYSYVYEYRPRPLDLYKYSTGTISVSGSTVTGSGTAFTDSMVGSVIRFTTSTTVEPTGAEGYFKAGSSDHSDNPYAEQAIVTSVTNGTTLTIDHSLSGTYSATKYTISSLVDIHISMWRYYIDYAVALYARSIGSEQRNEYFANSRRSLKECAGASKTYLDSQSIEVGALDWHDIAIVE